jgi:4-hydroxy-tetrahydrodipicolinate reductase
VSRSNLSIGIHGATGRMGLRLIQLIAEDPELKLTAALARDGNPQIGRDASVIAGLAPGGVVVSSSLAVDLGIDVMIDFSVPSATPTVAGLCRTRKIPLVVGTTGFEPAERRELELLAEQIPILIAPNMSRAVNLLMKLVGVAAQALGSAADIAIVERHHKTKKDAPSGTALRLAEIAGRTATSHRDGAAKGGPAEPSRQAEVTVHALRIADSPGEHTVVFGLKGETIELSHRALNRDGFARGSLDAAKFLAGKPAGLYTMADVLEC